MQPIIPIKIMIVDDHPDIRNALRLFVTTREDLVLAAEAESGEEALKLCAEITPNVILLDVRMPGMGGLAAIKALHHNFPMVPVIALTNYQSDEIGQQVLQAGASGFLYKNLTPNELEKAIRAVCAG